MEMRLKDRRYSLNATPVTTGFTAIIEAYTDKYRPDYPDIVADFPLLTKVRMPLACSAGF